MSKYFNCVDFEDEAVLNDGSLNYELVAHHFIEFMSGEDNAPELIEKCYHALEWIMHDDYRKQAAANTGPSGA